MTSKASGVRRRELRDYVQHKRGCPKAPNVLWTERTGCTCGLQALLDGPAIEPAEKELRWTLDNVYTIARRESLRTELRPEMWGHVLRLCEKVGCQSRGVLRDNGGAVGEDR